MKSFSTHSFSMFEAVLHLDKLLKVAAGVLDWDVVERHLCDSDSPQWGFLLLLRSSKSGR